VSEMQQLADDETAGDSAMTELRRQIELIDDQLAIEERGGGVRGGGRRMLKRLRK
jgi:hypothetical protein